jgi:hypothetical protein
MKKCGRIEEFRCHSFLTAILDLPPSFGKRAHNFSGLSCCARLRSILKRTVILKGPTERRSSTFACLSLRRMMIGIASCQRPNLHTTTRGMSLFRPRRSNLIPVSRSAPQWDWAASQYRLLMPLSSVSRTPWHEQSSIYRRLKTVKRRLLTRIAKTLSTRLASRSCFPQNTSHSKTRAHENCGHVGSVPFLSRNGSARSLIDWIFVLLLRSTRCFTCLFCSPTRHWAGFNRRLRRSKRRATWNTRSTRSSRTEMCGFAPMYSELNTWCRGLVMV